MKKTNFFLFILFLMIIFLLLPKENVYADCGYPALKEEPIEKYDLVVVGKVKEIKKSNETDYCAGTLNYVLFEVEKSFKEETPKEIIIEWYGYTYPDLKENTTFLTYLNKKRERYEIGLLQQPVIEFNPTEEDLKELEEKSKMFIPTGTNDLSKEFSYLENPLNELLMLLGFLFSVLLTATFTTIIEIKKRKGKR